MPETTSLVIQVKSDSVTKATKNLKGLGYQAKKTATATGRFGKTAGGSAAGVRKASVATKGLASATKSLLLPLAAILGPLAVLRKTLSAGVNIGKWRAQLLTATGSVEAAAFQFQELTRFAAETPFALEQSIATFLKMKNLGLDPTADSMRKLGNLASGLGKDFEETSEAVAKATIGNAESLRDMGFRFNKEGNKVTVGFRDMTLEVENNSLKIRDAILKIADTNFKGAMTNEMDTIGGKLSNLGDRWDQMWIGIAESGVSDWIGDIFDAMGGHFQKFEELFTTGAIEKELESWKVAFSLIWEHAQKVWKDMGDSYNTFAAKMGFSETEGLWDGFVSGMKQVPIAYGGLLQVLGLFPEAMGDIANLAGKAFFTQLGVWMDRAMESFGEAVKSMANPGKALWDSFNGNYRLPMTVFADNMKESATGANDVAETIAKGGAAIMEKYEGKIGAIGVKMADAVAKTQKLHDEARSLLEEGVAPLTAPKDIAVDVPHLLGLPTAETPEELGPDKQTIYEKQEEQLAERLARKQAQIDKANATALERNKAFNEKKAAQDKQDAKDLADYQRKEKLAGAANLADGLADIAAAFGKKGAVAHKVLATTAATIDMYAGATAAMAAPDLPFSTRAIAAAGVIASGMANIASINSAGSYANGGIIPGNSPSGDRLQANVNSGEMILNQKQQANLFKIADGGSNSGGNVTVNNYGNDNVETKTDSDGNMQIIIRQAADLAKSELADEVNTGAGDFAPMMQNTFGLSRGV